MQKTTIGLAGVIVGLLINFAFAQSGRESSYAEAFRQKADLQRGQCGLGCSARESGMVSAS
jgi:hypothetical protein